VSRPRASLGEAVLVHGGLAAACAAVLYPVLWVVKTATDAGGRIGASGAWPVPREPTLAHLERVVFARDFAGRLVFFDQLGNSIVVSLAATVIGLLFALTAAYAFSRFVFVGRMAGLRAMIVSQMFPAVVTAVPLLFLLDLLGLFGTTAGLVLVYATSSVPFSIWMLKGYFDALPKDLDEAALLDGASAWVAFRHVLLPLVRPGLAITALYAFMTAWNEFVLAALFLDDVSRYTLPVTLQQSVGGFDPDWGAFAAGSLLVSLPVVAGFFVAQKQLTSGLASGAVKG
jgi:arabinogalactan oligomer/maltooligosaccharide transport system permease protein